MLFLGRWTWPQLISFCNLIWWNQPAGEQHLGNLNFSKNQIGFPRKGSNFRSMNTSDEVEFLQILSRVMAAALGHESCLWRDFQTYVVMVVMTNATETIEHFSSLIGTLSKVVDVLFGRLLIKSTTVSVSTCWNVVRMEFRIQIIDILCVVPIDGNYRGCEFLTSGAKKVIDWL